jgi:hypothetical protein
MENREAGMADQECKMEPVFTFTIFRSRFPIFHCGYVESRRDVSGNLPCRRNNTSQAKEPATTFQHAGRAVVAGSLACDDLDR